MSKISNTLNLRHWLVSMYPRPWRERYGPEFEALLEECLHTPLDALDILLGALDAHLEMPFESDWRFMNMVNKLRTSVLIVFAAYIGLVIGGLSLYGLVDDSPVGPLTKTNGPLQISWLGIQVGAAVGLLAVVAGGSPLAFAVLRRVLTTAREDLRWLLVPVGAFLALLLYGVFMLSVALGWLRLPGVARAVSPGEFPLGNRLLLGGFMLLFVLGAIGSVAAVWKVVSNTDAREYAIRILGRITPVRPVEFAFLPAVIATAAMLMVLIGTLIFGVLARAAMPDWFASNLGLLLINTTASYTLTVAIMTFSTALALFGVVRGYSSRKLA